MTLWYVLYSKKDCLKSIRAKELLQVMGADYWEEVLPSNDDWPTPVVFVEEDYIGGYEDLQWFYSRKNRYERKKWKERQFE